MLKKLLTLITLLSDRKSTRLNSSHQIISYAVFCLKKPSAVCASMPGRREPPPQTDGPGTPTAPISASPTAVFSPSRWGHSLWRDSLTWPRSRRIDNEAGEGLILGVAADRSLVDTRGASLSDDRVGLELHLPSRIDESGDDNHGAHRAHVAEDGAVDPADSLPVVVSHKVRSRSHNIRHRRTGLDERGLDDRQTAPCLRGWIWIAGTVGPDRRGCSDRDVVAGAYCPAEADDRLIG